MEKRWKYFDMRKSAGYEKWIYASGEKVIELTKARYKTSYPYLINFDNYIGSGSGTKVTKTRISALRTIKSLMREHDIYKIW